MKDGRNMLLVALMSGLVVSSVALADDETEQPGGGSGEAKGRGWFASMDADGNGQVTFEEFKAFHEKMMEQRFKNLDKNGDKVLTPDEKPEGMGGRRGRHAAAHGAGKEAHPGKADDSKQVAE